MAKTLTPDCPCCKAFAEQPRVSGRVTVFTMHGVTHAVPQMWLAGRLFNLGSSMPQAFESWAWHCSIELTKGAAV